MASSTLLPAGFFFFFIFYPPRLKTGFFGFAGSAEKIPFLSTVNRRRIPRKISTHFRAGDFSFLSAENENRFLASQIRLEKSLFSIHRIGVGFPENPAHIFERAFFFFNRRDWKTNIQFRRFRRKIFFFYPSKSETDFPKNQHIFPSGHFSFLSAENENRFLASQIRPKKSPFLIRRNYPPIFFGAFLFLFFFCWQATCALPSAASA